MIPSINEFLKEIHASDLPLSEDQAQRAAQFAHILHRENEAQNLTRILGVKEFVDGHLRDVVELLGSPTLGRRILDVGSGSGVPGLLGAALCAESDRTWLLTESEKMKADYLARAIQELGLKRASAIPKRTEEIVGVYNPDTVIARAVGTVDKIANWIWSCSTWNNLILFKSKGWEKEWEEAKSTRFGKKLTVIHTHEYSYDGKTRLLVSLKRK
jgi:16S rRNA (guanine(527)-N(7))-methyltransferase RsmG